MDAAHGFCALEFPAVSIASPEFLLEAKEPICCTVTEIPVTEIPVTEIAVRTR
jgi:hypothetical protein